MDLGIDVGGTSIKFGLVDASHRITHKSTLTTQAELGFEAMADAIAHEAVRLVEEAQLSINELNSIGVGVPSVVNPHNQHVVFANNLNWRDVDLLGRLRKHLSVPMFIADDADCAALGEVVAGGAQGVKNALMMTFGTGVGGGFIIDGNIYAGGDGFGCEPGHTILHVDGDACTCGRRGCLEAYTSIPALIRQAQQAARAHPDSLLHRLCDHELERLDGRLIFEAYDQNDSVAHSVVDQYHTHIAEGLASLHNAFRPEVMILGGGISARGERLLKPVMEKMVERLFAVDLLGIPRVVVAELGNDAGMVGAARLAQRSR